MFVVFDTSLYKGVLFGGATKKKGHGSLLGGRKMDATHEYLRNKVSFNGSILYNTTRGR